MNPRNCNFLLPDNMMKFSNSRTLFCQVNYNFVCGDQIRKQFLFFFTVCPNCCYECSGHYVFRSDKGLPGGSAGDNNLAVLQRSCQFIFGNWNNVYLTQEMLTEFLC